MPGITPQQSCQWSHSKSYMLNVCMFVFLFCFVLLSKEITIFKTILRELMLLKFLFHLEIVEVLK